MWTMGRAFSALWGKAVAPTEGRVSHRRLALKSEVEVVTDL